MKHYNSDRDDIGSNVSTQQCLNSGSLKRRDDSDELLELPQQADGVEDYGYISEDEAVLPEFSFHDANDNLITEEEFNEITERELAHEAKRHTSPALSRQVACRLSIDLQLAL